MAEFAEMRTMDIWYARLSEQDLLGAIDAAAGSAKGADKKQATAAQKNAEKAARKAHTRDSLQALSKLAELVDGRYRIVSQPPVVVPLRDLSKTHGYSVDELEEMVHEQFRAYRETLAGRSAPAAGAVRVGRHGPQGRGRRQCRHAGVHRLVAGPRRAGPLVPAGEGSDRRRSWRIICRRVATSSPASAWCRDSGGCRRRATSSWAGRRARRPTGYLYWRQLRDMKGSAVVEAMAPATLAFYARVCGGTLARAHARSGDPVALAAYLGAKDKFDQSITDFSERYADQNEQDYQAFCDAVRSGRLEAVEGI